MKIIVKEIPFSEVKVGELGLLLESREVEVDGDKQVVRVLTLSKD